MIYFGDSSALVKRYIRETGTPWVKEILHRSRRSERLITKVTGAEIAAALARKQRMGEISDKNRRKALRTFLQHFRRSYTKIEVSDTVVDLAIQLTQRHPLRGYDAIQLASAMIIDADIKRAKKPGLTFVSADNILCEAAQVEKLLTENPN
ncbi:type II toxin-antitoxin system VapC family toxin [Candidatus Poribacteria bacterium]|nr:type II toxin-antitoxin system VapC family toxin [Candidatus Poribacteria bacterium]